MFWAVFMIFVAQPLTFPCFSPKNATFNISCGLGYLLLKRRNLQFSGFSSTRIAIHNTSRVSGWQVSCRTVPYMQKQPSLGGTEAQFPTQHAQKTSYDHVKMRCVCPHDQCCCKKPSVRAMWSLQCSRACAQEQNIANWYQGFVCYHCTVIVVSPLALPIGLETLAAKPSWDDVNSSACLLIFLAWRSETCQFCSSAYSVSQSVSQ